MPPVPPPAGGPRGDGEPRGAVTHSAVRVAVDAMGGDRAPGDVVAGAAAATARGTARIVLVGATSAVAAALDAAAVPHSAEIEVVDAADVVGMADDPALAVRAKPGASVRVAARLIADGDADVLLSAGSTGATVAAAVLELGRVPGLRRPAVAARIPVRGGVAVLVDAGGTADATREVLVASARAGAAYVQVLRASSPRQAHEPAPRVGLLNVGAEVGKGGVAVREAHELLLGSPGFVGNVEPADVLAGVVDVVVADGFTGNVFLKTLEAAAASTAQDGPAGRRHRHDRAALVLGVGGDVLVAHGAAGADDVTAAVELATRVHGTAEVLRTVLARTVRG